MTNRKQKVLDHLKALGAAPKRSLGQNFLIGDVIIQKVTDLAKKSKCKQIIEIGPGLGALTEDLRQLGRPFRVLEMDRQFSAHWRAEGLEVLEGDALKADWHSLELSDCLLVSNLPYQISSSLVVERSLEPAGLSEMILMFQKEVAQRLRAEPKTKSYGLLTVIAQAAWEVRTVCDAGPREFFPPPNVASRVLHFQKSRQFDGDWGFFLKILKAGFAKRRKYLLSNLNSVILERNLSAKDLVGSLEAMGHSQQVRAEELSVQHWVQLARQLCQ
jgi:16S rRNA (adenine1518-N6/adenine1519-N6)-dimethyltransferase